MSQQPSYSLTDYMNAFRRRLPLFLYVCVPILLIAVGFAIGLPNIYRSSVEMKVDLEGPQVTTVETVTLATFADQYVATLQRSVLSRDNMLRWIREFDVYPDMMAGGASDTELVQRMQGDIRISMVTTGVLDSRSGRELELIEGFKVGFDHRDPETSQKVAATLADAFLEADKALAAERIDPVLAFLAAQMRDKLAEISSLESQLADFKEKHAGQMPDNLSLNMSALDRAERDLETVRQQIRSLEQDRIYRKAQLEEVVKSSASATELQRLEQEYVQLLAKYGPDHPDLIRVKRQIEALTAGGSVSGESAEIAQLSTELAGLLQRYSEEHPDVVRLKRQIEMLREEQQSTITRLRGDPEGDPRFLELRAQLNAIDSELEGLRNRAAELRERIRDSEQRIAATPQVEREFLALERDLSAARETYRDLQKDYQDAERRGAFAKTELGARLKQLNEAWVPDQPASPPRLAIMILGAFLAFSLGGMAAIAAEGLDSKVRGSRDIFVLFNTQPIATIPVVQNSLSRVARRKRIILVTGVLLITVAVVLGLPGLSRLTGLI